MGHPDKPGDDEFGLAHPTEFLTSGRRHVLVMFMESSTPPADQAEARTERHLRLLAELAELGMTLARTIVAQAEDGAELAFARLARAVRQTLALEAKLAEGGQLRRERQAREHKHQREAKVRRMVETAIEADAHESDIDDLLYDLNEHLADLDDTDFTHRPLIEVVASICQDLGVTFDPHQWQDEPPHPRHPGQGPPGGPPSRDPGGSAVRLPLGPGSPLRGVRDDEAELQQPPSPPPLEVGDREAVEGA
jgi:hypothetical protein